MSCPLCEKRKARRECPALGRMICSICCATKRLREIDCPSDCPHLAAAREHPAAVVKRQHERDAAVLLPVIQHLTERQGQLFFLFHNVIALHKPDGLMRLYDGDVMQAAGSLAATLETAAKGIIYEHASNSLPARRLGAEFKGMLDEIRKEGAAVPDSEAAVVLRAIEDGARKANLAVKDGGSTEYIDLMERALRYSPLSRTGRSPAPEGDAESLIERPGSIILP